MRIYLDACAVSRLLDEDAQARIIAEADAVERILQSVQNGLLLWIGSEALRREVQKNKDDMKQSTSLLLFRHCHEMFRDEQLVTPRKDELEAVGYDSYDALHLAITEHTRTELLFTTDDRFIRKARRGVGQPLIRVANPLEWLRGEV